MSDFSSRRETGLDIVRALAILSVLVAHAVILYYPGVTFVHFFGGFGVELFFVLSGFLIGSIFLKTCDRGLTSRSLLLFWARRWFRTLPAYYFALFAVWFSTGKFHLYSLFFLQGFYRAHKPYIPLPISWSLVVEEWFYLLFPLVCALFLAMKGRKGFLYAAVLFVAAPLLWRLTQHLACGDGFIACSSPENTRINSFRFDSIAIGALLAYADSRYSLRGSLEKHKHRIYGLAFTAFILLLVNSNAAIWDLPFKTGQGFNLVFSFTVSGMVSALILTAFHLREPQFPEPLRKFVYYISLTSYSNYLWHLMVIGALAPHIPADRPFWFFILLLVVPCLVAGILYLLIEKPFLRVRDRLTHKQTGANTPAVS